MLILLTCRPGESIAGGIVITDITGHPQELFNQSLEDMLNDLELANTAPKPKAQSLSSGSPTSQAQPDSTEVCSSQAFAVGQEGGACTTAITLYHPFHSCWPELDSHGFFCVHAVQRLSMSVYRTVCCCCTHPLVPCVLQCSMLSGLLPSTLCR